MSSENEPEIWSSDTGQWIPCFDSCQLNIIGYQISKMYAVNPPLLIFKGKALGARLLQSDISH